MYLGGNDRQHSGFRGQVLALAFCFLFKVQVKKASFGRLTTVKKCLRH